MTTLEFGTDISILGDFVTDIFRFQVIRKFHDGSVSGHYFVNNIVFYHQGKRLLLVYEDWYGGRDGLDYLSFISRF